MNNMAEEYYNKLAEFYDDATTSKGSWNPPSYIYSKIRENISNNTDIIDIGIGTGKSIEKIYKEKIYSSITGVDISEEMISICRKKYPDINLEKISSLDDILNINKKFNLIICSGTFEFIENIDNFFIMCKKIIKDDGVLCFTYEPIIKFHPYQGLEKELTIKDTNSSLYTDGFYTFRHSPATIISHLKKNGFYIKEDSEFVSYKKYGESIIYHLIVSVN